MAERDPEIRLGRYTERAEFYVSRGAYESVADVVESALDLLDEHERKLIAVMRVKVAEAIADPRPALPMEEAFRLLDEAKARRRA